MSAQARADNPRLSIVVPLYNEAARFERLNGAVRDFQANAPNFDYELVLVNDGSQDATQELLEGLRARLLAGRGGADDSLRGVRLIALERNQGKGQALRQGVLAARGDWILTLDADMATPPSQLLEWREKGFLDLEANPALHQAFFGDREHGLSMVDDHTHRRFMGKVFNTLVQLITDLPLRDTQCGFKLYTREIAHQSFALVRNWGWAHDVEITKVLLDLGCQVRTLPIKWTAIDGSKIKPFSDALRMFWELSRIQLGFYWRFRLGWGRPAPGLAPGRGYERLAWVWWLALLVLICATFQDYGFASDERVQAEYGRGVVNYYLSGFSDKSVMHIKNLYLYGGLFEALADLFARVAPWEPYQSRHLLMALVGLWGVVGAWRLAGHLAGPRAAFWAGALLSLTPMYYGHIFNNSRDIPFAVAYLWSVYYLVRVAAHLPRVPRGLAIKLGLALGACLGIRVEGAIIVFYLAVLILVWASRRVPARQPGALLGDLYVALKTLLPSLVIAYVIMLLSWPWAQQNPLYNPAFAYYVSTKFGHNHPQLFDGRNYCSLNPPWSYIPQYLLAKLPEMLLAGWALFLILCLRAGWGRPAPAQGIRWDVPSLGLLLSLVLPPSLIIVAHGALYDGLPPLLAVCGGLALDRGLILLAAWGKKLVLAAICLLVLALL
ncbi:MAG: glycosyltransferase [Pseudomonadota bacterium]